MNFLDKFQSKKEEVAPVSDNRRVMEEALAKLKRHSSERSAHGQHAPKPASAEIIDQACMCAVWDLPFITQYEKQPNGRFLAKATVKVKEGPASRETSAGRNVTLAADLIDGDEPPCPWCGGKGHYHCNCGAVVCGGRVKGNIFTCRTSCGETWLTGNPVKEIQCTAAPNEPQQWQAPPRGSTWAAPPKPATATPHKRLLLAPGSQLPVKSGK